MSANLTKKAVRDVQESVQGLANELAKFAASYKKVPILQTKSALVVKFNLVRSHLFQVSNQRVDFINLKNKEMVYLCTQEMNIFAKLIEIFSQPRLGNSDIEEIAVFASSLLALLGDVESRISTLNIAA